MGNYNSQYESYYSSLSNRRKNYNKYSFNSGNTAGNSTGNLFKGSFIIKRLVIDLIGVLVLFTIIITCKLVVTQNTIAVYNYSKEIVNESYDINKVIDSTKSIDIGKIISNVQKTINEIKQKLDGGNSFTKEVKNQFIAPASGVISSPFGESVDPVTKEKKTNQGVVIDLKENTEVLCSYNGKVKDVGEDASLGKYILIDNGDGIETKYAHLNDCNVKKDDLVEKGQVIALSGSTGKVKASSLYFEILYMGENKNPEDYFVFKKSE